jgi:hypothetical protein
MLKHLIPRIPLSDLPALLGFTVLGAAIAGCYGVLHDQIMFAIGIHNASYIGGAFGLALTYVMIRPAVPEPETSDGESTSPQEVS